MLIVIQAKTTGYSSVVVLSILYNAVALLIPYKYCRASYARIRADSRFQQNSYGAVVVLLDLHIRTEHPFLNGYAVRG